MHTRYALPLIAISLVIMMIAPGYAMAADGSATSSLDVQADSEHADQYDEVVNIADPSAITNPDTWLPSPRGIWLGASTEESLFRLSEVMEEDNRFALASTVMFNSTQIMNGASVTVIRSPISPVGVESMTLYIHRLLSPSWNMTSGIDLDADDVLVASIDVNMSDASVTSGGDYWTVDGRTYVEVHAPIYSGVMYLLNWYVVYEADARPAIYLSTQDVANDELMETRVGIWNKAAPDDISTKNHAWAIDPGISYDMLNGLGNGLYAESMYVESGDKMRFRINLPTHIGTWYHTIMLPFATDDHTLNATVEIIQGSDPDSSYSVVWAEDRTDWFDYMLACSSGSMGSVVGGNIWCQITFNEPVRLNMMFIDSPGTALDYAHNQGIFYLDGEAHTIHARPWASYQFSAFALTSPSLDPADAPPMLEVQENQPGNYFGTVIGNFFFAVGGALVKTIVLAPIGMFFQTVGVMMIRADLSSNGTLLSGDLFGWMTNSIDAIWDVLVGIGEFLWAVGEALYDGIVWLVDAISDYLPVLLGLLIIGVALVLFFVPIYAQLKLWGIAWRLAEGDVQKAAAQASDLAGEVEDVYKSARKVKRRLW